MSRKLTTRFFTSKIAKYEKQTGKGVPTTPVKPVTPTKQDS